MKILSFIFEMIAGITILFIVAIALLLNPTFDT